jgi:hypothetical protein
VRTQGKNGLGVSIALAFLALKQWLVFSSCVLAVALTTRALAQSTTTLSAAADTYTRSGTYANTNFGSETTLLIRKATPSEGFDRNGYLRFTLPQLSGNVTSAWLRLYGRHDAGGAGVAIRVLPVTGAANFSETQLTYNNAASQAPAVFSTPTPPPAVTWARRPTASPTARPVVRWCATGSSTSVAAGLGARPSQAA